MRITKVYTRTGDRGTTRLVGGAEAAKDAPRVEAYGTIDELNSVLGMARAEIQPSPSKAGATLQTMLEAIQHDLFDLGGDLATPVADRWPGMEHLDGEDVSRIERWIDGLNDSLPPLEEFILPGGGRVGAALHAARTVCRRAERRAVSMLHEEPEANPDGVRYLNRLSDLLFVMARWAAREIGEPEFTWRRKSERAQEADPFP